MLKHYNQADKAAGKDSAPTISFICNKLWKLH